MFPLSCKILFNANTLGVLLHFLFECSWYWGKVEEDVACDPICFSKCRLGFSTWMLPAGSLTSRCEGRFSPFLPSHAPWILFLLTFLRMTAPSSQSQCKLSYVLVVLRCIPSPHLFPIASLSSLSSLLCSGSSLPSLDELDLYFNAHADVDSVGLGQPKVPHL